MTTSAARLRDVTKGDRYAEVNSSGELVVNNAGSVTSDILAIPNMQYITVDATLSDFTDGGATVGTYTTTITVPKGAVVTQTLLDSITGFIGDTSAVITVGDGTDVDRYNTGTPSVFTTADTVSAGAVSGTAYHSAAKAVVLTVTSAADFTSVTAGAVKVTIFYYQAVDHS
jgi:hypothetical protein